MKLIVNNIIFKCLFFAIITGYIIFFAPFGLDDGDGGYTLALCWRVLNGEIPFKDFIMIRPPVSVYFHTLLIQPIHENYQLIFERSLFYVIIGAYSYFGADIIFNSFWNSTEGFNKWLLASIAFVFSVHNFPPMAWHTVDGIFFAVFGFWMLVLHPQRWVIPVAMLFFVLSALCKQPFYIIPFAAFYFVWIFNKRIGHVLIAVLSFIVFISIGIFILNQFDALHAFLKYTTGSTTIKDLLQAGIINYIQIRALVWVVLATLVFVIVEKKEVIKNSILHKCIFLLIVLAPFVVEFVIYLNSFYSNPVDKHLFLKAGQIGTKYLMVILAIFLLSRLTLFAQDRSIYFLLLIAWTASISWGYQTPVLFALPLVAGLFKFVTASSRQRMVWGIGFLCIGVVIFSFGYMKPYATNERSQLTHSLSDIYPKLSYIKVSNEMNIKYREFSNLILKHGNNFKTLPGMPLSNYITSTKSPIVIDWALNAELNYSIDEVYHSLCISKAVVFVETNPDFSSSEYSIDRFGSLLTYKVTKNWTKIETGKNFIVYKFEQTGVDVGTEI